MIDKIERWDVKKYQNDNPLDQDNSKSLLLDLSGTLDLLGVDYWLVFGTALGAYRDNQFIPWDTDIDVAMFFTDRKKLIKSIGALEEMGIQLVRDIGDILTFIRDNIPIDIYLFRKERKVYSCQRIRSSNKHPTYTIPCSQIDQCFHEIDFCGKKFNLVNNPDKYLTRLYKDWKTPMDGTDHHAHE